jgi:hypothetical protein
VLPLKRREEFARQAENARRSARTYLILYHGQEKTRTTRAVVRATTL